MSRLTDLASKATAGPWDFFESANKHHPFFITHPIKTPYGGSSTPVGTTVSIENKPNPEREEANAALIVALVNRVDDIQRLYDAAEEIAASVTMPVDSDLAAAVEALRDLLGGE